MESTESTGPHVPAQGEQIIPASEARQVPDIAEVMRGHIGQLSERNKAVGGKLFADIGKDRSRVLISETPVVEGTDSYRMAVTEDGIMAIQVSRANKKHFTKDVLEQEIREAIDRVSNQRFLESNKGGGYYRNTGSNSPQIQFPEGLLIWQNRSVRLDSYSSDIKLLTSPSEELVSKMVQTARDRFQLLSAEKIATATRKQAVAESLKGI